MNAIRTIRTTISDIKELSIPNIRNKIYDPEQFKGVHKAFLMLENELDTLERKTDKTDLRLIGDNDKCLFNSVYALVDELENKLECKEN